MFIDFNALKERIIKRQASLASETLRTAGAKPEEGRLLVSAGQYQGLQLALDEAQGLVDEAKKRGDKA